MKYNQLLEKRLYLLKILLHLLYNLIPIGEIVIHYFEIIIKLTRFPLSAAIAFSALAGFFIHNQGLCTAVLPVFAGVFFLSCGASALNQYQERETDRFMERTQNRPIPARLISPLFALIISAILAAAGLAMLYFTSPTAFWLGAFNLFWYNAVYTPLKLKTRFVVLIGALTGAIPPLIGWTASGGSIFSPTILFVALFMYLWQVPHFLLLALKYSGEYKAAGFPALSKAPNHENIKWIIFIWLMWTSLSTFFFPLFHILTNGFIIAALLIINGWVILYFYRMLISRHNTLNFSFAFRFIHVYQSIVLMILILGRLLPNG